VLVFVRVQLYRPINYWLCVVCVDSGFSWVIELTVVCMMMTKKVSTFEDDD